MKQATLVILSTFFFVFACQKVPVTGRQQLGLVNDEQLMAYSEQQYDSLMNAWDIATKGKSVLMMKEAGSKISKAAEKYLNEHGYKKLANSFDWEFNMVKNDTVANAWCMPGGKVAFYTGMLPITQSLEGMAVVIGHEIAHAVARHGNERMSQGLALQLGGTALSVAVSSKPQQTQFLFMQAFGLGAQIGVMLPYSRKHELEADEIGLIFMAMAGYNPNEAVAFWTRMEQMSDGGMPPGLNFLSTHPAHQTRIDSIKNNFLPQALKYYNK
jgi:predicted Zn-dependent protease